MNNLNKIMIIVIIIVVAFAGIILYDNSIQKQQNNIYNQQQKTYQRDSDGDGYEDEVDAFPNDATEWIDGDGDGVGDNTDFFPNDKTKWWDNDSDGDGVGDTVDTLPYDSNEQYDNDGDGIGDNSDLDDDNDGFEDLDDFYPFKNAKIKISLYAYTVWDLVDSGVDAEDAEVYFEISVNNETIAYAPSENNYWRTLMKDTANCDWDVVFDIPDNIDVQTVQIRMYDLDIQYPVNVSEQLDIDEHDESLECTVNYNIISEKWDGDDNDGITNGSDDGIENKLDAPNAYLRYDIDTI